MTARSFARLPRLRRGDIVAGISVAVVLVPQALAYAEIAGMPAHHGLFAAALPTIAAATLASSRYLQTGPVAMTALLTFGALSVVAPPGSDEYVALAVLLALLVGLVRLVLGLLGGGVVAYLMSQPVLVGFTSAAAMLIVASQLPTAVGVESNASRIVLRAWDALSVPGDWHLPTVGFAVVAALVVVGGRWVHSRFPTIVVALVLGVLFSVLLGFDGSTVAFVPEGFPPLTRSMPFAETWRLLVPAVVIAVVGFAEPAAIARTFAAQDRDRWDPDRELLAQGLANIASAVTSGFPVGGSFSRSAIAKSAGAETRWSGAVVGLVVLAFLPFAGVLEPLPRSVLAAIVIVSVFRLIRIVAMFRLIKITWGQSVVAWGTFAATLWFAPRIDIGVIVGVALATLVHLRREALIRVESGVVDGELHLRPYGVLYFGSAPRLSDALLDNLSEHRDVGRVVIDLGRLGRVDYTGAVALKTFIDECNSAGLDAQLINVPPHASGTLSRYWGDDLAKVVHPD